MQLSREEVERCAVFAMNLISFGVRAGIGAAKQNPSASADEVHQAAMTALQPMIAQKYTSAVVMAQISGDLEVE